MTRNHGSLFLAGVAGFEPTINGSEPFALPLGDTPMNKVNRGFVVRQIPSMNQVGRGFVARQTPAHFFIIPCIYLV